MRGPPQVLVLELKDDLHGVILEAEDEERADVPVASCRDRGGVQASPGTPTKLGSVPIRTILVPTDFSNSANAALELANEVAEAFDARIVLLHVVDLHYQLMPSGLLVVPAPIPGDVIRRAKERARAALDDLAGKLPRVGRRLVRRGHARDVTLAVAGAIKADLIVMGTHGRRGVQHLFIGSVAEYVVRNARVPVTTVRAPVAAARAGRGGPPR